MQSRQDCYCPFLEPCRRLPIGSDGNVLSPEKTNQRSGNNKSERNPHERESLSEKGESWEAGVLWGGQHGRKEQRSDMRLRFLLIESHQQLVNQITTVTAADQPRSSWEEVFTSFFLSLSRSLSQAHIF